MLRPDAHLQETNYENVTAECPTCKHVIVFNRASDLKTFERISGRDVVCLRDECRAPFRIVGDSINNAHEMLLFAGEALFEQKRYMECVTQTCQAYEMFFNLHINVEIVLKPYNKERGALDALNKRASALHGRTGKFAFENMRNLSLRVAIEAGANGALDAPRADQFIASIASRVTTPADTELDIIADEKTRAHFLRIKGSTIHVERNKVAHKYGYRPPRELARSLLDEARSTLFPLTYVLKLRPDLGHLGFSA